MDIAPVSPQDKVTAERLKLRKDGYLITLLKSRAEPEYNWPSTLQGKAQILKWKRSRWLGTGAIIKPPLVALDFDVDHEAAMAAICAAVLAEFPKLRTAPVRFGSGFKELWLVASAPGQAFKRYASFEWRKPDWKPGDKSAFLEAFGGLVMRYFGFLGPHTLAADGSILVSYEWLEADGPPPVSKLIRLTEAEVARIVDIVDLTLGGLGWSKVLRSASGKQGGEKLYDLEGNMVFNVIGYGELSLEDLVDMAARDHRLDERCSPSFLAGNAADLNRCRIRSDGGWLRIFDHKSWNSHFPAADDPDALYATARERLARLAALAKGSA